MGIHDLQNLFGLMVVVSLGILLIAYLVRRKKRLEKIPANAKTPVKKTAERKTIRPTVMSILYMVWWVILAPLWALPSWLSGASGVGGSYYYGSNVLHPLALTYLGGGFFIMIPLAFFICGVVGFKNRKRDMDPKNATVLGWVNVVGLIWQIICIIVAVSISGGRI